MSEKAGKPESGHNKIIIAAEISTASVAIGAAAIALWRKQRRNAQTFERTDYASRAAILNHDKLSEDKREIINHAAARIYIATLHSSSGIITRESLVDAMGVPKHHLNQMLGYLSDDGNKLIDRRPDSIDAARRGYFATDALVWAVDEGEGYDLLQQAVADVINDQF